MIKMNFSLRKKKKPNKLPKIENQDEKNRKKTINLLKRSKQL